MGSRCSVCGFRSAGAALLARGEREAGLALLAAGLPGVADRADKAEFVAFLAQDAKARADSRRASALAALERHLLARA